MLPVNTCSELEQFRVPVDVDNVKEVDEGFIVNPEHTCNQLYGKHTS